MENLPEEQIIHFARLGYELHQQQQQEHARQQVAAQHAAAAPAPIPPPPSTTLQASAQVVIRNWVEKRKVEAIRRLKQNDHKADVVATLQAHVEHNTFPKDIATKLKPYEQYPKTLPAMEVQAFQAEEAAAILECLKQLLAIRLRGHNRDLTLQRDILNDFINPHRMLEEAAADLGPAKFPDSILHDIPQLFNHAYTLHLLNQPAPREPAQQPPQAMDVANEVESKAVTDLRKQMLVLTNTIKNLTKKSGGENHHPKNQKNKSGSGKGGIGQQDKSHAARGKSPSRGRSKSRDTSQTNRRGRSRSRSSQQEKPTGQQGRNQGKGQGRKQSKQQDRSRSKSNTSRR